MLNPLDSGAWVGLGKKDGSWDEWMDGWWRSGRWN